MSLTGIGASGIDRQINPLLQNTASVTDQGLVLPGSVNLGSDGPTNFDLGISNFFCELWVNVKSYNRTQHLIFRASSAVPGTGDNWSICVSGDTDAFYKFYIRIPYDIISVTSTSEIQINEWTHVAASFVNPNLYLFVNGILQGISTVPSPPVYLPASSTFIGTSGPVSDWVVTNANFKDIRMFRDGTLPTGSFSPVQAPFGPAPPPYVSGSNEVFNLGQLYFQNSILF